MPASSSCKPGLFADTPDGPFSLNLLFDRASCGGPALRRCGSMATGCTSARPDSIAGAEERLARIAMSVSCPGTSRLHHPARRAIPAALAERVLDGRSSTGLPARRGRRSVRGHDFLPTRRAARAFAALIARAVGGRRSLLPRIVPLGRWPTRPRRFDRRLRCSPPPDRPAGAPADPDAARPGMVAGGRPRHAAAAAGEPLLVPSSPADAVGLAGDLGVLMDALRHGGCRGTTSRPRSRRTFQVLRDHAATSCDRRRGLARILAERGARDPARRQQHAIRAEAERLPRERPATPIVAAGSTGSMPATAALLAAIARLPNGAVVLPGLDQDLDERAWAAIGAPPRRMRRSTRCTATHKPCCAALAGASALQRDGAMQRSARRLRPARPAAACSRRRCGRPRRPISGPR